MRWKWINFTILLQLRLNKLQSFENWLQIITVKENYRARNVRERLCRHYYSLTPKPSGTETYGR